MNAPAQLPIGVLLPTRNSRALLPQHLEALRRWQDRVAELVVVDSESQDGTVEFLRANLPAGLARFLAHPPGLYESWNFGIAQLRAEFTYISTIGDSIASASLERLASIAHQWQADVVLSLPRFSGPGARRMRGRWPLERLISRDHVNEPRLLSGAEAFAWSATHVPGGILGSSSSNIYRTRFLQEHPFPTCYRRVSDTGWAIENAFRARIVVAPGLESEFLVHAPADKPSSEPVGQTRRRLHQLAREVFARELAASAGSLTPLAQLLEEFWSAAERLLDANAHYQELRGRGSFASLRPAVLRARWQRFRLRKQEVRCREAVLRALSPRR